MISEDSYGRGPVERRMTPFRGVVRSGNSGGPVVDGDGDVLTTVFAASLADGPPSGLGVPNDVVAAGARGPARRGRQRPLRRLSLRVSGARVWLSVTLDRGGGSGHGQSALRARAPASPSPSAPISTRPWR